MANTTTRPHRRRRRNSGTHTQEDLWKKLWPELDIISLAENGIEAVNQALKELPDIIFLDIKMPGKTGLEVAEELADEWPAEKAFPQIVFVTAYDEYD